MDSQSIRCAARWTDCCLRRFVGRRKSADSKHQHVNGSRRIWRRKSKNCSRSEVARCQNSSKWTDCSSNSKRRLAGLSRKPRWRFSSSPSHSMAIEHNRSSNSLPRVSVIVPCRNEARFIARCLESIVANDYPRDKLEILVVDGMSDDQTWNIVGDIARERPEVKGLRNPRLITPAALNLGISHARGEIVFRIDAHARVARDYLRLCVEGLRKHEADNIG